MSEQNILPIEKSIYAGFWKRFFAFFIDINIILIFSLLYVLIGSLFLPGNYKVTSPFGIWSTSDILESHKNEETLSDGTVASKEITITKEKEFGKWEYIYKKEETKIGEKSESSEFEIEDGVKVDNSRTDKWDIAVLLILFYGVLFEASKFQATPGKMLLRTKVVNSYGAKPNLIRTIVRNISKYLSALLMFIGFMMTGWTKRKQGLHDKISSCCVINCASDVAETNNVDDSSKTLVVTLWVLAFLFIGFPLIGMLIAFVLPILFNP